MLKLDCSKAAARLGWRPELHLREALAMTANWYRERMQGGDMRAFTCSQICNYEQHVKAIAAIRASCCGGHD
jgi:CDP-glucose 4,6-dehydratase